MTGEKDMEERQFLTVSQVCKRLGLSDTAVKRYIASGRLKAYRPSKKILILETDLTAFLERSVIAPKVS